MLTVASARATHLWGVEAEVFFGVAGLAATDVYDCLAVAVRFCLYNP